ncbi:energy transducer TonB [Thiohalophilus sp.]|uniref:energy transducer TonB n=1 Tax=Thiohalophilus sp. TaxID=3028392 RepID=UPI003976A1CA
MVEEEVDLGTNLCFHSYSAPPIFRISIALLVAIAIHVLVLLYWWPLKPVQAPEFPGWLNVNLVAGLEESEKPQVEDNQHEPDTTQNQKKHEKESAIESREEKEVTPEPRQTKTEKKADIVNSENASVEDKPEKKHVAANTFVQADSKPFAMHNPKPVFPISARRRGMEGTVILLVQVTAKGEVSSVSVSQSSGYRVLDNSAIRAVERWKFRPARRQDDAVSTSVEVPVRFLLRDE